MAKGKQMTTFHLNEQVHAGFKKLAGEEKRDMSAVVEELMTRWIGEHSSPRTDRKQMDHAVGLLTKAVIEQLQRNPQFAQAAGGRSDRSAARNSW